MSIRKKLNAYLIILLISHLAISFVSWNLNKKSAMLESKIQHFETLKTELDNIKLIVVESALVASSSIIDKDSGRMSTERLNFINDSEVKLSESLIALKENASDAKRKNLDELEKQLVILNGLIYGDLKTAIETFSHTEEIERYIGDTSTEANKLVDEIAKIQNAEVITEREKLLTVRNESDILEYGITGIISFILLPLMLISVNAMASTLQRAVKAVDKISKGDTDINIEHTHRADEVGVLNNATIRLKGVFDETARLKHMIDDMPINVMTADMQNDFKIDYANNASINLIKSLESLISIKASDIVGTSIDVFHKNPQRVRDILSDSRNLPHNAIIRLGTETLELKISAIKDKNGKYINPMLVWSNVTAKFKIADDFEQSVGQIVESTTEAAENLRISSGNLERAARDTGDQAKYVQNSAKAVTSNVLDVSSAAEELSNSIKDISNQAGASANIADKAAESATQVSKTVNVLIDEANKIGSIIDMIQTIAEQTNLLALNATIESARAGAAGKGFAVVANEVKNLASQTQGATEEIKQQIELMQNVTSNVAVDIKNITDVIFKIQEISKSISASVEKQTSATANIARNASRASNETKIVTESISSVSETANTTYQNSSALSQSAEDLNRLSEKLKLGVENFVKIVRAS
jgi:methyl-accepting chemotaxis protein